MLIDGLTAANDLGLTTVVPSRVVVHTDARRRPIQLDALRIDFKLTAPSKLYWAGRPAMRIVQALHWLKDTLPTDRAQVHATVVGPARRIPPGPRAPRRSAHRDHDAAGVDAGGCPRPARRWAPRDRSRRRRDDATAQPCRTAATPAGARP